MSTTTYAARAIPGPSTTTEFQAVQDRQQQTTWVRTHFGPLIGAAVGLVLLSLPLIVLYAMIADNPDAARAGRVLLQTVIGVLLGSAAVTVIAAVMTRILGGMIRSATERGVAEVQSLESLHEELQSVSTHLSAIVARLEALVGHRVDAVEQVVERDRVEVEKLAKEHTGFARAVLEQLQRIEPGVKEFRQRLESVERQVEEQDAVIADVATAESILARVNGHGQVHQLHPPDPRRTR